MSSTEQQTLMVIVGIVAVAIFVVLFYSYWAHRRSQRAAAGLRAEREEREAIQAALTAPVPDGGAESCTDARKMPSAFPGTGSLMIVGYGSFGANLVASFLASAERSGLEQTVGSVLLVEFDQDVQQRFLDKMPAVFLERLVLTQSAALAGGFGNRPIAEIETLEMRLHWVNRVYEAAEEVIDRHRRRSSRSSEPSQVICFTSPGSTGYVGYVAAKRLREEFPASQFMGLLAYSHVDRMRGQIKDVVEKHLENGVHGFVVADNLRDVDAPDRKPERNDFAMLCTVLSLLSSTKHAAVGTAGNNVFRHLIPEQGGLASFRVSFSTLPAFRFAPHPKVTRYYVHGQAVVDMMLRRLALIDDVPAGVFAELGHEKTMRYDVVVAPIVPDDLLWVDHQVRDAVERAMSPRRNFELRFAPVAMPINPDKPDCPIMVVSLQALTNPWEHLDEVSYPQLEEPRPTSALPMPVGEAASVITPPPTNHTAPQPLSGIASLDGTAALLADPPEDHHA